MKTYKVKVRKMPIEEVEVTVEASSPDEAKELALDAASEMEWDVWTILTTGAMIPFPPVEVKEVPEMEQDSMPPDEDNMHGHGFDQQE